jgi:hypothetical protein
LPFIVSFNHELFCLILWNHRIDSMCLSYVYLMCSFGENCGSTDFIEMVRLTVVFDLVARGPLGGSMRELAHF